MEQTLINDGLPFLGSALPADLAGVELRRAITEHRVLRMMRNTFRDARVPDSREVRVAAIALHAPKDAIVADDTVAWLQGVDTNDPRDRFSFSPSLIVPNHACRPQHPGVRVREGTIDDCDVVEEGGLRLQTNLRATADMLRLKWRPNALATADAMCRHNLIDKGELAEFIRPLRRLPGIPQARALVRLVDPRSMSWGESVLKLRLVDAGFPMPALQHEVNDPRIGVRYLDCAYVAPRVGVEYDGKEFHTAESDREHDAERRELLSDILGWRWEIARRDDLIGTNDALEWRVGEKLGLTPRPRSW
ncbi:hypothetical protein EK0264_02370 [Epidermidibacterium keratini]|uniref:DUF559 domain-containing protein n=1 Tax=Epidermidibacterium keratini TaxID=1891644 RepID=A0A7L4YJJ8_9ACTN|nr:hypothetical protein [Epidermidibacterium keratini]QHB99247.1 hypothetical protein EK0264_02370 [Epidermidibacterium keratini]